VRDDGIGAGGEVERGREKECGEICGFEALEGVLAMCPLTHGKGSGRTTNLCESLSEFAEHTIWGIGIQVVRG